jgi:hypothetical protein
MTAGSTTAGATATRADIAAHTTLDDVPGQARTRLAQCPLDFIGVAAAGSQHAESIPALRAALRGLVTEGDTTVAADREPWPATKHCGLTDQVLPGDVAATVADLSVCPCAIRSLRLTATNTLQER